MDLIDVVPICRAIRGRRLLRFEHAGLERVVAPYCTGISHKNNSVLRAIQVSGASTSNKFNFGKLWAISQMKNPAVLDEEFVPDDPNYNPDDSAMKLILCRLERRAHPKGRTKPALAPAKSRSA